MTVAIESSVRAAWPLVALGIIARAAAGLFVHGLREFGRPAVIERATGKVRAA